MNIKTKIAVAGTITLICGVIAGSLVFERYEVAKVDNKLSNPQFTHSCLNHSAMEFLDSNGKLSVSVWNIYKQQNNGWHNVLSRLHKRSELILLQEASLNDDLANFIYSTNKVADMVRAFKRLNTVNGVMNIANVPAINVCANLTMEPWIRLAKSALISQYALSNGKRLLVINVHSINFSWFLSEYKKQLNVLSDAIAKHQGPVILAGDFNTWRLARNTLLNKLALQFNLKEAISKNDKRVRFMGMPLDHLFYRGLNLNSVHVTNTDSSDHNPITANFSL